MDSGYRIVGPLSSRPRAGGGGAGAARGGASRLIFVNSDIVVEPGFVRCHVETLAANGVLGCGPGYPRTCWTNKVFGRFLDVLHERLQNLTGLSDWSGSASASSYTPCLTCFSGESTEPRAGAQLVKSAVR